MNEIAGGLTSVRSQSFRNDCDQAKAWSRETCK